MDRIFEKAIESAAYITERNSFYPEIALILGTGLGGLTELLTEKVVIPYRKIPYFPHSTVQSHSGELICGMLGGKSILVMSGRFHLYEGYSAQEVSFPVRVMQQLKIKDLIITNVSGGLNPHFMPGQIVAVRDHINLMPDNPLRGVNDERLGVRFPDMKYAYDPHKIKIAQNAAESIKYNLKEGIYVGLQGPNLETPAEYVYLRKIGGDMVGMSTVPEVLVAKHAEISTLVLSMISNQCFPVESIKETSVEDVIEVATKFTPQFVKLIFEVITRL